ncbi:hypothetical protein [Tabrizicola sp. BL-A-41-H6]|uniref:hypothetical protein n=1 Tax=Tabrizicola sp. BL-A-41-H6 TaxID=3421107 RepID=UPI003D669A4D
MTADPTITVVNRYRLTAGAEAFVAVVTAMARRVETEGHLGVRSYHFFRADGEGRAVVTYDSPEAWVGHHDIAMGWPEMAAVRAVSDLEEIALYGPFSDAMRAWLEKAKLLGRLRQAGEAVTGFRRS